MRVPVYLAGSRQLGWRPLAQWPSHRRPAPLERSWIEDQGSLTAKLISLSGGQFQVQVLRQVVEKPELSEQRCLNMRAHEVALVREVILYGHNQAWVFARSVLPLKSLTGRLRHLRKQDSRPLGAFLFSQPHLQRSAIAASRISRHHGYLPASVECERPLWGRRSVFYLNNKPLLVSEVFLDALMAQLQVQPKSFNPPTD